MTALSLDGRGRIDLADDRPPSLTLAGAASTGRSSLDRAAAHQLGQGLAVTGDANRIEAALRGFALSAPAWRLALKDGGADIRLDKSLRLTAASGPTLTVSPAGGSSLALVNADGRTSGAMKLTLAGLGIPSLDVAVPRYRIAAGGQGDADLDLGLHFDGALLHTASLDGTGTAVFGAGKARFSPTDCFDAKLARLGEDTPPLALALHAKLCTDGPAPFASLDARGWKLQARIEQADAQLPSAQAKVDGGKAVLTLAAHNGPISGRLDLSTVHAVDAAADRRFNPITAAGFLTLAGGEWRGPIQLRDAAKGRALAMVAVTQSASGADGHAEIAADLDFAPKGLQPAELSPLAALITKVDAKTRFNGQIAWKAGGVTSSGHFTSAGAAFASPFGQVAGAKVDVTLSSLLPPTADPGQSFTADKVGWIAPLTAVSAGFAITPTSLEIAQAQATLAHGTVSLNALSIPYAPDRVLAGALILKQLDLGELVAGSSLSDAVKIDAKIDGTVPFSAGPAGVRLTDGLVASIGAGRLSIKRAALTGAVATAGAAGAQPNAIQDFAYQALENLAFDSLEARVASRPQGRLGAVFHIKGRNDPPKQTQTRIGLFDLLRGHAFDKPIDLPKGTPVDLTLDTSLNFDELLKAYGQFGKGSAPVQP